MDFWTNTSNLTHYGDPPMPAMWGWWIKEICTPIVMTVGIIGNCLSIAVMKSESLRSKSYSHFLCALAVFDSLTLIGREVRMIDDIYIQMGEKGVFKDFNDAACKTYNFLEHMCYLMSSWLIVVMAAERVVAVCMPFRKTMLRTQTGAIAIIFSLFVILSYTQVFRFIMMGSLEDDCQVLDEYLALYVGLYIYFYQFVLILFLPFLLVLVFNSMVLYQIYRVRRAASSETRSRVVARTHKTTFMLLAISFTYLVTQLPFVIISVVMYVEMYHGSDPEKLYSILIPMSELISVIAYTNYGINFLIYVFSGKSFRFELRRIFTRERNSSSSGTRTREEVLRLQ